jgi:hypothetical protein
LADGRLAGGDQGRPARAVAARARSRDELTSRQVKLAVGTSVHDPTGPVARLPFNVVAEFEADPI